MGLDIHMCRLFKRYSRGEILVEEFTEYVKKNLACGRSVLDYVEPRFRKFREVIREYPVRIGRH